MKNRKKNSFGVEVEVRLIFVTGR